MFYSSPIFSPVGALTAASDGERLLALWSPTQTPPPLAPGKTVSLCDRLPIFSLTRDWLRCYFAGEHPSPRDLPLAPQGTPYRRAVWQCLLDIPYGEVTTYGAIARVLSDSAGHATSARAVGGAIGHNPIAILIPCHRVLGADGSLTGYNGGLEMKRALLTHEGVL